VRENPKGRPKRRRYSVSRIKATYTYDPGEVAKLLGIHRNTVRHWIKEGLRTIDDRRPFLVHGLTLKSFLAARQGARRRKCGPGEFYCFKCRVPRAAWGAMAEIADRTPTVSKLTAVCELCGTKMHRTIRRSDIEKIALVLELLPKASERLNDRPDASVDCDLEKDASNVDNGCGRIRRFEYGG
jgi:excisionase family DNA binding protein